jgi:hypothetical protein
LSFFRPSFQSFGACRLDLFDLLPHEAQACHVAPQLGKCVHEAIQSARNDPGLVFPQRVKALGYALLHAHRLHRHGPRVEPKLGQSTAVSEPRDVRRANDNFIPREIAF